MTMILRQNKITNTLKVAEGRETMYLLFHSNEL